MQKIAAIDAGSNALRMMIGRLNDAGQVEPVENIRLPVRLGQDVFGAGSVQEKTARQTVAAFQHFQRVARDEGVVKIRAIATSALREATNRDFVLDRIARESGIEVEIISGAEEARLIHLAVANAVKLKGKRAVLIDIGGGSVEVSISENQNITSTESYNMGTVRLLQMLDGGDDSAFWLLPARKHFSLLAREYAEAARRRIDREIAGARVNICVGTGGAVEDLGRLRQRLFKQNSDRFVTRGELRDLVKMLDGMSVKERMRKLKLRPDRADVILPAAIVLQLMVHEARVRRVSIPQVGLKDGVLLELAEEIRRGHPILRRSQVLRSALALGRKYQIDARHASRTATWTRQLFDQSRPLHSLGQEERLLLEVGALLHDIGQFISIANHDEHGYYILKANDLIGLSDAQQEIVADLVRYHRRPLPDVADSGFQSLPQQDRITVSKLAALLRLADALEVSHTNRVAGMALVEKKRHWQLTIAGRGDLLLERWALDRRRGLFEAVFGVQLEIKAGS